MADHDIFISYSKHDRARVERMVAALEGEGWTVYWDQRLVAGDAWHTQLAAALASARCVIVAWSTKSVASNWVRDEATQALQRGVLVPVLIEPVAIPLGFGQVHTIAVMDAAGNLLPDAVPDLCAGVRRHLGPGPTAGAPATRPIATAPAAASPAPPVPPRKPGRIARPLFPIVLPILTVATMLAYVYNLEDLALAWLLAALGAGVAASVYRTMARAWIDRFRFSASLLSAMSIPAATVLAIIVALYLGPVMFRFLYGLLAGVLGAALAVAAVTQWWTIKTQPMTRVAGYAATAGGAWFAAAFGVSTLVVDEVARYFANASRLTGLFEYWHGILNAAFLGDLRRVSTDFDVMLLLAGAVMAAIIGRALRAGLVHRPG